MPVSARKGRREEGASVLNWVEIDADALRANLEAFDRRLGPARLGAVVKANAYGHGAADLALSLRERVDGFAVAGLEEAEAIAAAGVGRPVFLLSGFHESNEIEPVARRGFVPVLHTAEQLDQLAAVSLARVLSVWVKFDTGMHRIGFAPDHAAAVMARLRGLPNVNCTGVMSHLACADDRSDPASRSQIGLFEQITARLDRPRSLANSAGICAWPASHCDWVRPGIMMYGCTPMRDASEADLDLRPVMSLCARIIAVADRRKGDAIGYGGDWRCPEDMRVGVVACGYADGYPRHAPSGTPVWVAGRRSAIVGRVSMDMITIDLRGLDHVGVGEPVELWGEHVAATEIAAAAGTISYELLSGVTARVPRVLTPYAQG